MVEPKPNTPSPIISPMTVNEELIECIDSNINASKVISPQCIKAASAINFPPIPLSLENISSSLESLDEIPGTDSSLLSLLNKDIFPPKAPIQAVKKRKIDSVGSVSDVDVSPIFSNFDPNSISGFTQATGFGTSSSQATSHSHIIPETNYSTSSTSSNNLYKYRRSNTSVTSNIVSNINNNEQIIIIEQGAPGLNDQNDENTSDIFSNDIKFAKELEASIFGKVKDLSVKKNFSKKMYVLKFSKVSDDIKYNMLLTNKLGPWHIKCRVPRAQQYSRGVIGPVGLDNSEGELSSYLCECNPSITNVKRLKKGISKVPTLSLLIEFSSSTLPEFVNFGFQRFKVRQFVPSPWQCFNCQRFGHNASDCKAKPRCLLCAKDHKTDNCPLKVSEDTVNEKELKCANCMGNHAANYGGCQRMKTAKVVEKVRAHHGLSYRDALTSVNNNNNVTKNNSNLNSDTPLSSHASHQSASQSLFFRSPPKVLVDSGTQTEKNCQTENSEFVKKFSILLVKLLSCLDVTGANNKMTEILNIVQTVMKIDISNDIHHNVNVEAAVSNSAKQNSGNTPSYSSSASSGPTYNSHPNNKRSSDTLKNNTTNSVKPKRGKSSR